MLRGRTLIFYGAFAGAAVIVALILGYSFSLGQSLGAQRVQAQETRTASYFTPTPSPSATATTTETATPTETATSTPTSTDTPRPTATETATPTVAPSSPTPVAPKAVVTAAPAAPAPTQIIFPPHIFGPVLIRPRTFYAYQLGVLSSGERVNGVIQVSFNAGLSNMFGTPDIDVIMDTGHGPVATWNAVQSGFQFHFVAPVRDSYTLILSNQRASVNAKQVSVDFLP